MAIETDFALSAYDYDLPAANIAQQPASRRDISRLLVTDCLADQLYHRHFSDICEYFTPGDLLVVNNTKVFPARLLGAKETGGKAELLILDYPQDMQPVDPDDQAGWQKALIVGLVKSSKRPKPSSRLIFSDQLYGVVDELLADGKVQLYLHFYGDLAQLLEERGELPLPPYIGREGGQTDEDRLRYQTVYAQETGAVAAPTAGLHFTQELFDKIRARGVEVANVTLHVGYGTFAPVREEDIRHHNIHSEYLMISAQTAAQVNATKAAGGRIWAVGTTSVRALEFAADENGMVSEKKGLCEHYIFPGYSFKVVDNLITNFHLPKSSLLFLVSALVGRQRLFRIYREAIEAGYRFYSYGDAMAFITRHPREDL